jgi:energy-coupling factor transporter ATP-binding protein EcfA2
MPPFTLSQTFEFEYTQYFHPAQDEAARQETAVVARRLRLAHFEEQTTIETFGFTANPAAAPRDLAPLRWLHAGQSVILYGSTGVGKTHIAQATSRASEGSSLEHPSCHYARMPMFAPAFGVVIVRPGARATGVCVGVPWLSVLGSRMTRMTNNRPARDRGCCFWCCGRIGRCRFAQLADLHSQTVGSARDAEGVVPIACVWAASFF